MPNLKISQFTNLATSAQSPTYLLPLADSGVSNFKMSLDALFSNIGANTTSGQVISTTVSTGAAVTNPGILVTRGDNKRSVQMWVSNAAAPAPQILLNSEIITAQGDNVASITFNKTNEGGGQAPATASLGQITFNTNGSTAAAMSVLSVNSSGGIGNNVTFYSTRKGSFSNVGVWGIDDWGTFRVSRNLGPFYADIQLSDPTKLFMLGDADNLNDSTNTALHIRGTADTMKNLVVQSRASQSVNVFEHRSSANALLLQISPAGLFSPGTAAAVDLATALLPFKDLYLAGSSGTPASFNFQITGTATAARVITLPDATCTLSASASALTSGRLPFVTTGGLLTDSANLTFDIASGNFTSINAEVPAFILTRSGVLTWRVGGSATAGDNTFNVILNSTKALIVDTGFRLGVGTAALGSAQFSVLSAASTNPGAVIRGAASQSANLQEWQNSAGTVLASVSAAGQFGIGTAPSTVRNVNSTLPTTATSGDYAGAFFDVNTTPASASTSSNSGIYGQARWLGSATSPGAYNTGVFSSTSVGGSASIYQNAGFFGAASHLGTGTVTLNYAFNAVAANSGGGTVSNNRGLQVATTASASSTTTSNYGIYIGTPSISGGGAITTNYGLFIDNQTGASTNWALYIAGGNSFFADAANIVLGTTTGTKFGTATTQKIAFFNSTPIAQPSSTGVTAGFTAGAGAAVLDDSTFTGNVGSKAYTLGDIVAHLKNLGLIAAS